VPVYYLEPSALVKYYVTEPGSTWVRQVVDEEANVLVSAEITIAEVAAALGALPGWAAFPAANATRFGGGLRVIY
jgi:predicted nucleic acid-binding protein